MKILIVRMFADILNINNYNCQELGLAKSLIKAFPDLGMNITFSPIRWIVLSTKIRYLSLLRTKQNRIFLTNVKYPGHVEILKTDPGRNSYYIRNAHDPIVSMEDFVEVQKLIAKRARRHREEKSQQRRGISDAECRAS